MISNTVLVACESFGEALDGTRVAEAIGRGLLAGDPELRLDPCPIDWLSAERLPAEERLPAAGSLPANFDARMRRARAVVLVAVSLDHRTLLRRGAIFEIATRARQSGVPCYAVAEHNGLDLFEARILDLQVTLEVGGERALADEEQALANKERALAAAGRELAAMI